MTFEFKPGQPRKSAERTTLAGLKLAAKAGNVPIAFKTVGNGTALVYTERVNYYLSDGEKLRTWLRENYGLN
jgi:hypothetical protein